MLEHVNPFFLDRKIKNVKLLDLNSYKVPTQSNFIISTFKEDILKELHYSHLLFLATEYTESPIIFSSFDLYERQIANLLFKDVSGVNYIWSQAKGIPSRGQRTHGNSKTARRIRLILQHRIIQMLKLFGRRKRNIFPTLVQAEYINRLWKNNWLEEWSEAKLFVDMIVAINTTRAPFNPVLLSKAQTNGYTRTGKAAKLGKAKKITKTFTIGVPVFFSQWIYCDPLPEGFPVRLHIADDIRRQMGKKQNKKKQASAKLY